MHVFEYYLSIRVFFVYSLQPIIQERKGRRSAGQDPRVLSGTGFDRYTTYQGGAGIGKVSKEHEDESENNKTEA